MALFQKKLADVFRVGAGGGLCFCGINMYFKNDKFYDDWVMPLFSRMEPETAYAVAQQAAKYNLVSKSKLQESRLLVSKQPSASSKVDFEDPLHEEDEASKDLEPLGDFRGSREDLIHREYRLSEDLAQGCDSGCHSRSCDSDFEPDDSCPGLYLDDPSGLTHELLSEDLDSYCPTSKPPCVDCGSYHSDFKCGEGKSFVSTRKAYLSELSHYKNDLRACESPKSERSCVTPDSPSLSMRVNIASPLRSSKMSLATVVDGSNPAYDRDHGEEMVDGVDRMELECTCQVEECIVSCKHDDGSRTDIVHITESVEGGCRCQGHLAAVGEPDDEGTSAAV